MKEKQELIEVVLIIWEREVCRVSSMEELKWLNDSMEKIIKKIEEGKNEQA